MVRLIKPTYFPPISHWKHILSGNILWDIKSTYNKQTLTNRTYIDSPNGELMLSIPIKHSGNIGPRAYSEVKIDYSFNWKKNHFKSIKISYQSSPYFEFYEADLVNLYQSNFEYLYRFNLASINLISKWMEETIDEKKINLNDFNNGKIDDLTFLSKTKRTKNKIRKKYTQTFELKNGFINDLSVLDLIFNCGPNSKEYM